MAGFHLVLPGSIRTRKSSNIETADIRPGSVKQHLAALGRYCRSLIEIKDHVHSLGLLVEEAEERATKPWYQRLPDD